MLFSPMSDWQAFYDGFNPDDPDDGRVICWYCKRWTHHLEVEVRHPGGRVEKMRTRVCDKGLAYDPLVPRRCEHYRVRPPQYRVRLPDGAFPRGWKRYDG